MEVFHTISMKNVQTDKQAISSIEAQINKITNLAEQFKGSSDHTTWLIDTQHILLDIFGKRSIIYQTFLSISWNPSAESAIVDIYTYEDKLNAMKKNAYILGLERAKGILESGINQINRKGIKNVFQITSDTELSNNIVKILSIIDNKLRKTVRSEPNNETEIQDKIEDLFFGANLDQEFSREKEAIEYSSKNYIPDFTFKKMNTALEVKLCSKKDREKTIISEINDDTVAYKTKYTNLIFVIYDVGIIRDQDKFRDSLESNENVIVRIIKH